jgi:hypothetical protein
MNDRCSGASAAKRQIGVARKNAGDLRQSRQAVILSWLSVYLYFICFRCSFGGFFASRPISSSEREYSSFAPISRAFSTNNLRCSSSSRFRFFVLDVTAYFPQEIGLIRTPNVSLSADIRDATLESSALALFIRVTTTFKSLATAISIGSAGFLPPTGFHSLR